MGALHEGPGTVQYGQSLASATPPSCSSRPEGAPACWRPGGQGDDADYRQPEPIQMGLPLFRLRQQVLVTQQPLVRRRSHDHRRHRLDEGAGIR